MTTEQLVITDEANSTVFYKKVATTFTPTFTVTTSTPGNNSNLGLIVGLSVGIPCGVAVIIAVVVTIICLCRRKEINLDKHEDFNSTSLSNSIPTITQISRDQLYENLPIQKREDIYENSPASENWYETRLPAS